MSPIKHISLFALMAGALTVSAVETLPPCITKTSNDVAPNTKQTLLCDEMGAAREEGTGVTQYTCRPAMYKDSFSANVFVAKTDPNKTTQVLKVVFTNSKSGDETRKVYSIATSDRTFYWELDNMGSCQVAADETKNIGSFIPTNLAVNDAK